LWVLVLTFLILVSGSAQAGDEDDVDGDGEYGEEGREKKGEEGGEEDQFPGWVQHPDHGRWYHKFAAHLPEWEILDIDKTTVDNPPSKVLPPGWMAREHDYIDTVTGDISAEWPTGFQNQVSFKANYTKLVGYISDAFRSHWAELVKLVLDKRSGSSREALDSYVSSLPDSFMVAVLRVIKAPILLQDRTEQASTEMPESHIMEMVQLLIQSYSATKERNLQSPAQTSSAKMLFIIMGQDYDHYHYDDAYTLPKYMADGLEGLFENKSCWSYGFKVSSHFVDPAQLQGHAAQSDLSIVAFIRQFFPDIELHVLDPCWELDKLKDSSFLDSYDVVVNSHFGPIGESLPVDARYPRLGFAAFERALEKTKAYVWNPPWIVAISNKSYIPLVLRDHGIPAVATIPTPIDEASGSPLEIAEWLILQASRMGWHSLFTKPDEQGYMRNLAVYDLRGQRSHESVIKTLAGRIADLRNNGIRGICAQKYVASFKDNYELRLYFFDGQFGTATANKVDAYLFSDGKRHDLFHWDWFDFEGGTLNSTEYKFREKLLPLAQRALRVLADNPPSPARQLPAGVRFHPLFRVDLGCCLDASDSGYDEADGWFVNEAEAMPNFNLNHFTRPLVNTYGRWGIYKDDNWSPDFRSNAIMTKMVERAAATWYPTTERAALELGRFVKRVIEARRQLPTHDASSTVRPEL